MDEYNKILISGKENRQIMLKQGLSEKINKINKPGET